MTLRNIFLRGLPATTSRGWFEVADLEHQLVAFADRAALPWASRFTVEPAAFVAHLAARISDRASPSRLLEEVAGPDLYLACGCCLGDSAACGEFLTQYGPVIDRAWVRLPDTLDTAEDARAVFIEGLLVAEAKQAPRLASYRGRGPLRTWVQIAATRAVIDCERPFGASEKLRRFGPMRC